MLWGHDFCFDIYAAQEGEPELRRQLRAARLAERNAKMRAALAEKLAMDEDEARRKEEQVQLKDNFKEIVNTWKSKHKVGGPLTSAEVFLSVTVQWVWIMRVLFEHKHKCGEYTLNSITWFLAMWMATLLNAPAFLSRVTSVVS